LVYIDMFYWYVYICIISNKIIFILKFNFSKIVLLMAKLSSNYN